jgi:hypothetical protein
LPAAKRKIVTKENEQFQHIKFTNAVKHTPSQPPTFILLDEQLLGVRAVIHVQHHRRHFPPKVTACYLAPIVFSTTLNTANIPESSH